MDRSFIQSVNKKHIIELSLKPMDLTNIHQQQKNHSSQVYIKKCIKEAHGWGYKTSLRAYENWNHITFLKVISWNKGQYTKNQEFDKWMDNKQCIPIEKVKENSKQKITFIRRCVWEESGK